VYLNVKEGLVYKIPVYLIQGTEDILTPMSLNKAYFEQLKAPQKEFIIVPGAAHGHNEAVINAQYNAVKKALSYNK
jgi:pimeloyl-ACP methyl ester carboxylesterase